MKEQKLDRFSVAGSCKTETGMYDPRFEHDNCGIGAVVNIKGIKTHATVENALKIEQVKMQRARQVTVLVFCFRYHTSFSPK